MIAVADVDSYTSREISPRYLEAWPAQGATGGTARVLTHPTPHPVCSFPPCSLWGSVTAYAVTAACVFCMRGGVLNQWGERVGCGPVGSSW